MYYKYNMYKFIFNFYVIERASVASNCTCLISRCLTMTCNGLANNVRAQYFRIFAKSIEREGDVTRCKIVSREVAAIAPAMIASYTRRIGINCTPVRKRIRGRISLSRLHPVRNLVCTEVCIAGTITVHDRRPVARCPLLVARRRVFPSTSTSTSVFSFGKWTGALFHAATGVQHRG